MSKQLSIQLLTEKAKQFCEFESKKKHYDIYGTTDGKAVGTYVEKRFKDLLSAQYNVEIGNSAKGIDLPSESINTDIKVTSSRQPQSSCPYKYSKQKILGLGYNLLVFVYEKNDDKTGEYAMLDFVHCVFIHKEQTADFQATKIINQIIANGKKNNDSEEIIKQDLLAHLQSINLPGDTTEHMAIVDTIYNTPPKQGYLTISNALQWRLQYGRVVNLEKSVKGVEKIK